MDQYHTAAVHYASRFLDKQPVVIDRLWMSELCYANAYRGGSNWPLMGRFLDRVILKHGGIYVYCLPENPRDHLCAYEALKATRPEMYNDILPVVIEYHKLWEKVKEWPHVHRYDWFKHTESGENSIQTFAAKIYEAASHRCEVQWKPGLSFQQRNFCGHLDSAEFLLVGDRTNPKKRRGNWYPFVDYSGSSLHLTKILEKLNVPEHKLAWTNYNNDDGDVFHQLVTIYSLQVLFLGSTLFDQAAKKLPKFKAMPNLLVINGGRSTYHPAYDLRWLNGKLLVEDLSLYFAGKRKQLCPL